MAREITTNLIMDIMLDLPPRSPATKVDFGIDSQQHYEALYFPIRGGEINSQSLDEALGDGEALTKLVQSCELNPHKDIVFKTPYDML